MKRLVIFLLVVLGAGVVVAEEPVYFADEKLKAAVERELGVSDPTPSDMVGLRYLNSYGRGITDLSGLEYATNLTSLSLSSNQNQITDISALSGLTNLTWLELQCNPLSKQAHCADVPSIISTNPDWTIVNAPNPYNCDCDGNSCACPCAGNMNVNKDHERDLDDLQNLSCLLLAAGPPFIQPVEPGHCGDLNADGQLDLEDLQAVAGILLDAGSPFISGCP